MEAPRPPYVEFVEHEVEDREASIAAGRLIVKSVTFAHITPAGSKERVERNAQEWLDYISQSLNQDRSESNAMPREWVEHFHKRFTAYKEGLELPEDGTPILTWPSINKAQATNLLNLNIRTVEDLAEANEDAIRAIGIGGRSLRDQARAWLEAAGDKGKIAGELTKLRTANSSLETKLESALEKIEQLEVALKASKSQLAEA